jgi:hypothetical protein
MRRVGETYGLQAFGCEKEQRALVRQTAGGEAAASQEMVVHRQKMRIKLVAGTEHTHF